MFRLHFHCHPPPQIHRAQNHYNNLNLFLVNHILCNPNHLYRCLKIHIDYFFGSQKLSSQKLSSQKNGSHFLEQNFFHINKKST
jgi:hypothetical protein